MKTPQIIATGGETVIPVSIFPYDDKLIELNEIKQKSEVKAIVLHFVSVLAVITLFSFDMHRYSTLITFLYFYLTSDIFFQPKTKFVYQMRSAYWVIVYYLLLGSSLRLSNITTEWQFLSGCLHILINLVLIASGSKQYTPQHAILLHIITCIILPINFSETFMITPVMDTGWNIFIFTLTWLIEVVAGGTYQPITILYLFNITLPILQAPIPITMIYAALLWTVRAVDRISTKKTTNDIPPVEDSQEFTTVVPIMNDNPEENDKTDEEEIIEWGNKPEEHINVRPRETTTPPESPKPPKPPKPIKKKKSKYLLPITKSSRPMRRKSSKKVQRTTTDTNTENNTIKDEDLLELYS